VAVVVAAAVAAVAVVVDAGKRNQPIRFEQLNKQQSLTS
jgi:hypothetical protein